MSTGDQQEAPPPSGLWRGWSRGRKIVTVVVGIAAALGSLEGGVGAITKTLDWIEEQRTPESEFDRTPHAGLEFWQGDRLGPMRATDGDEEVIRVDLEREAFYLRAPKLPPEAAIEICAWTDDAFFAARGDPAEDIPADDIECLQKGRGMADYEYASGNLVLRADAKNYLIGTRLRSYSSDQDQAFFASTQRFDEEKRRPLSAQRDPLYLIVYTDRNANRMIESGEYEAVHLEF